MANPFDQFDATPTANVNPFDQFDVKTRQNVVAEQPKTVGGFATNVVKSGGQFVGGLAHSIAHPIETVKTTGQLIGGAAYAMLPEKAQEWIISVANNPETVKRSIEMAKAVGGQYAKDYGSIEGFKNKLYTDPVGFAADVSTLLSGGAALAGKANMPATASKLATAAKYTNPLSVANLPVFPGAETTFAQIHSKAASGAVNFLADVTNPKAAAVLAATEGRAPQVINALRQPTREFTPGYRPTAAEVVTDLNLTKFPAAQAEWARQATTPYFQRGMEQNAALLAPLEIRPSTMAKLEEKRAAITTPMYKQATSAKTAVNLEPVVNTLDDLIAKNEGSSTVTNLLQGLKENLYRGGSKEGELLTNARQAGNVLDEVKVALRKEKDPYITGQLKEVKSSLENIIPGYAKAEETFATLSKPINQGEIATYLRDKLKSSLQEEAKLTPAQFAGAIENAPGTIKSATGLRRVEDLNAVLAPDQIKILNQIKEDIANKAKMEQQAKAGGKGFDALEAGQVPKAPHVFNKVVSIVNDIISRLQGKVDRKLAMELAMDMLDPAKAADTIEKAWARGENINYMKQIASEGAKKVGKAATSKENIAITQLQNALAKSQQQNQNALTGQ